MPMEATCAGQSQRRTEEAIGCPGAVVTSCGELPEELRLRAEQAALRTAKAALHPQSPSEAAE